MFSSRMVVFFYLVTTGWILTSAYVRIQPINHCMLSPLFLCLHDDSPRSVQFLFVLSVSHLLSTGLKVLGHYQPQLSPVLTFRLFIAM